MVGSRTITLLTSSEIYAFHLLIIVYCFSSVPTRHLANFFVEKAEDIIDIGQTLIVKVNSVYIIFCPSISHKNVNFLNLYEESLLY